MPITTIKVDSGVRDRLAALAGARGQTMGAFLGDVAERLAQEQRVEEIRVAYTRLAQEDPVGWRAYLAELTAWDSGADAADNAAAEEWPEYNQPPVDPGAGG